MTKEQCLVCQGIRKIRLPLRYPLSALQTDSSPSIASSKSFPCPECAPVTSDTRVMVLGAENIISTERDYPEKIFHQQLAHIIAEKLWEDGYIKFERVQHDPVTSSIRGTLGVVAPAVVATMEERIRERQTKIAEGVIARFRELTIEAYPPSHANAAKSWAFELADKALRQVMEIVK